MIKKLLKLFSGESEPAPPVLAPGEPDLKGFVEFVVTSVVDAPKDVAVSTEENEGTLLITIDCQKTDVGRIIGRKGKNIDCIRALVRGAAKRSNQRVNVEIAAK